MGASRLIESVVRALDILELLDMEGEMNITEISKRLDMEKSTVYRALNTLRARHYVNQDEDTLKYSNGYKLFEIGHNVARNTGLPKLALRFMRNLANTTGCAVNIGVRGGRKVICLGKIESDETVNISMNIGQSMPLYCTAMGKALLAYLPQRDVRTFLGRDVFEKLTNSTLSDVEALLTDLALARRRGYCVDYEEFIPGINSVAAPTFNAKGETIAALCVATARAQYGKPSRIDELGRAVAEAADDFTKSLGGRRPVAFNGEEKPLGYF